MDTWVIWNLTGAHVTDVTNASRTLLMDLKRWTGTTKSSGTMGIPRAMLPEIRSSSEVYGNAKGGLGGVPLAGDLGDQQAALFGQTCFGPGEAKNTYGTGCFMLMNTGEKPVLSKNGLLTTLGYKIGSQPAVYALEGSIAITGALVQWLRDNLGLIEKSSDVETLARTVEDNGGIYFVPAFSGLFAPYWRSMRAAPSSGMTRYVNKGHIARAVLEATAYQTREVLDAMEKDSGVKLTALKVDGGMVFNELLMQFQAESSMCRSSVRRWLRRPPWARLMLPGWRSGFWKDFDELRLNWGKDKEWKPSMPAEKA